MTFQNAVQDARELCLGGMSSMPAYRVDDQDARPWGHYIVMAVGQSSDGEEYCEKQIVIKPQHILSLQSHDLRRESWTVKQGVLTAIVDGERIEARAGETIHVPQGSMHCMANLTEELCIVHERQVGACRENDIRRYMDAYNRATDGEAVSELPAVALYRDILAAISGRQGNVLQ